jgi:hypothetical protein
MYAMHDEHFRLPGTVVAVDVKHFERCVGALVGIRASFIGDKYNELQSLILSQPYLCVGTDWTTAYFVSPREGFLTQLASGDSSVATVAKEALICIYASFFEQEYGLTIEGAIDMALAGGSPARLAFKNYGDDNLLYGNAQMIDKCFAFMKRYLTVEIELPTALIGWQYSQTKGFFLRDQSYIVNFWKPERPPGPPFRPYFFLGFYLRNRTFKSYGSGRVEELEQSMWEVMEDYGLVQEFVGNLAAKEAQIVGASGLPLNYILGKQYLLTDEERERLGQAKNIGMSLTHSIFNDLVNPEYRKAG